MSCAMYCSSSQDGLYSVFVLVDSDACIFYFKIWNFCDSTLLMRNLVICRHGVAQCELQRKNAVHLKRILVWMFFANTSLGASGMLQ
jgi:hypothetical protein